MTNFDAWHFYMKDVIAPASFISLSFYSMIATALQRRVFLGSEERPLFPNMYIILVGEPGIGKGVALDPIVTALRHHKLKKFRVDKNKEQTTEEQAQTLAALLAEMETSNNKEPNGEFKKMSSYEEPLLFPIAANAITYEALVKAHAQSLRSTFPVEKERYKNCPLLKQGLYNHSSLAFVLEEISSLFRKHTEDVAQYLITAFDCKDYKYQTIGRGVDRVINPCLNLLAGTTPQFMKSTFTDNLLNDGFASRVVFCFEPKNRFYRFESAVVTPEQVAAKNQVIAHLEKLAYLFGQVTYSPEAKEFMKHYIEVTIGEKQERINKDPKLIYYYSRKNIHVQKIAMAMHFAETSETEIQLSTCETAIQFLNNIEVGMHRALSRDGRNPLAPVIENIRKSLYLNFKTKLQIWEEHFLDLAGEHELEEALEYLMKTNKIVKMTNPDTKETVYTSKPK
jgi:RNA-binding protein YhbY